MKSTTFLTELPLPEEGQEIDAKSLYQVLQEVQDGRKKRGRRYEAAVVLTIIVLAKMAGETALSGIAHWARLRLEWIQSKLPLKRAALPCANTYQYICDHIAVDELNERLGAYFSIIKAEGVKPEGAESSASAVGRGEHHLALDGKSLRGTTVAGEQPQKAVQLISLYHVTQQYVRRQITVPGLGQERKTAMCLMQ